MGPRYSTLAANFDRRLADSRSEHGAGQLAMGSVNCGRRLTFVSQRSTKLVVPGLGFG